MSSSRSAVTDGMRYWGEAEKLVLAFDIGNSSSSVALTHLTWSCAPLSTPSSLRTVLTYPFSSPALTPIPSRTPSMMAYDRDDKPRMYGAEVLTAEGKERIREEGWVVVKGWKEQMRPVDSPPSFQPSADGKKKLLRKAKPAAASTALSYAARLAPVPSSMGASTTSLASMKGSMWSLSSEGLLDAVDGRADYDWVDLTINSMTKASIPVEKKRKVVVHSGPKLRDIYAAWLKHLTACARAWFGERTPNGEATFLRLWSTCVFVIAIPADWTTAETDMIRESMEDAGLLPEGFTVGRLIFVKEPASIAHFARRHTKDAEKTWLQEGGSFVLCDAAEEGVSIIGYTVASNHPRLRLRAYEPVSRLDAGTAAITSSFRTFLEARLARTKFKSPSIVLQLIEEFCTKVLPVFAGNGVTPDAEYKLRLQKDGPGMDHKIEKGIDSGARIRDGWMVLTAHDVEDVFKLAVDDIIVRLSSVLSRGGAKHILLSGGFGESPYLVHRLRETFRPPHASLVIPSIPAHSAVCEGALRFYLSETLQRRTTNFALGVMTAVDWATSWEKGIASREVSVGSGGQKYVLGKFTEIVAKDSPLDPSSRWSRTFNLKHDLSGDEPPILAETLWLHDADAALEGDDGWIIAPDGALALRSYL
ncbi:proteophosphoglycan ppg4 [Rhodotorula toruloides]|uniref:Proteophosphoglycan ppg4 n=1 Tax=Rhodotorula toruloides TaxID=5286 RepID=A0A511KKE1_RHOTO|nr:proteophosphoglycan ppg4 [Rhodotorula toruloides]